MRRLMAVVAGTVLLVVTGSALASSIPLSTAELMQAHAVQGNTDASYGGTSAAP